MSYLLRYLTSTRRGMIALFSAAAVSSGLAAHAANPSVGSDFSFEHPSLGSGYGAFAYRPSAPDVTFSGGAGIAANGSAFNVSEAGGAPDGNQVGFLQNHSSTGYTSTITQTITGLTIGKKYHVDFYDNGRTGYDFGNSLRVTVAGTSPTTVFDTAQVSSLNHFTPVTSADFIAQSTTETLTFSGGYTSGDHTTFIDKVVVSPTAGPYVNNPNFETATELKDSGYVYLDQNYAFRNNGGNIPAADRGGATFANQAGIAHNGYGGFNLIQAGGAPNGGEVGFLQGAGSSITETIFGLTPLSKYDVSFFTAGRPYYGANPFDVYLDGTSIFHSDGPGTTFALAHSNPFTAAGPTATLSFRGLGRQGYDVTSFIDDIHINQNGPATNAVPEPAFFQMAGLLAMGGLGFLKRRKLVA